MKMFRCCDCGCVFEEPLRKETTYEVMLGIDLPVRTYLLLELCPNCKGEEIEDYIEEDED